MNTSDILHEIKQILTIHNNIYNNNSEKANNLRGRVADRSVKVIEEIVSNPSNICLLECPHRKDSGSIRLMRKEKISVDSTFWALIVLCFLLFSIGVSIGVGYVAIADLENCAYKGMCVETPKGGK